MRTIGSFIKEARVRKKYSLQKLGEATKIKKGFIAALEKQDWGGLPDFPVLAGFAKNIAKALGINEEETVAILKRDYPPKSLSINPKPDVSDKFVWSPKLTFLVGVGVVLIAVVSYLLISYIRFLSPPSLEVMEPREEQVITEVILRVSGKTASDAVVTVNNQPFIVSDEGLFEGEIEVLEGTQEVKVKATSRSGKSTEVSRKIKVEFK
jgi:transcriptional regulator with XRE-family HTH domain